MGIDIFHGYGFGTAKPSGFVPVAISTPTPLSQAARLMLIVIYYAYASSNVAYLGNPFFVLVSCFDQVSGI
jgi:hypothetical protein